MVQEDKNEEAIFNAAIQIESRDEREAYLAEACGPDKKLRAAVEALLKAHYEAKSLLDEPVVGPEVTLGDSPLAEGPGTRIGRYKLLQLIGEGGFGVVYMAEQEKPIRRRVALKIIKLGMDTKQVIARFEAERQALAMMEHPNIAKVLDAGATETGRPYFVMELVKGIPITEYCDKNNLDTRQRLELFIEVCRAVQHAHQKGIIHRDIKPTNVLITLRDDDTPVPKIIDFGIAKATQARLTEKTLFTEFKQFIGTPEYMSPEQARMGELDIDTRSDIYALGVLLYELLTGTTPFDRETLRSSAYDELLKTIQETEPPKPSTRINTLGDALAGVAKHRHVEPGELCKLLRGELDWVVMKTLEKDRTRRYETANELVQDIQRHLRDEPVVAGPPSTVYRLRKFIRRHRSSVAVGLLVGAALVIGLCLATVGFLQASRERNIAETQRQRAGMNFQMARDAVDEMTRVAENELGDLAGTQQIQQQLLHKAQIFYAGFLEENSDSPAVREEIGQAYQQLGRIHMTLGQEAEAEEGFENAIDVFEELAAEFPNELDYHMALADTYCRRGLAELLMDTGRGEEAEKAFREAIAGYSKVIELEPDNWKARCWRGRAYEKLGQQERAIADYLRASELEAEGDAFDLDVFAWGLATGPEQMRNPALAVEVAKRSVEAFPEGHGSWATLGLAYYRNGQYEEALEALLKSVELGPSTLPGQENTLKDLHLAMTYHQLGQAEEARQRYDQAVEWMKEKEDWEDYHDNLYRFRAEVEELLGLEARSDPNEEEEVPEKAEGRSQRSEDRGQKTEDRRQ